MQPKDISRRGFVQTATAITAASLLGGRTTQAGEAGSQPLEAAADVICPHPFLTPAADFFTVARGNPKPHTLTGQALADARMTPDTWRLEITADPYVEPPHVRLAAEIDRPLTPSEGNALDLPALMELGRSHGVAFIKAMQCLNIPTPLGQGLWEGVPLREVLRLCGRTNNIRRIYFQGFHNNDPGQVFQSSLSYTQAMETPPGELPVFLAYRLNGEPIPPVRGGPVRMLVPWAHGFKSIKWLQHIFLTNDYRANDTYALQNNDPDSPLKTAAYLDEVPRSIEAGRPVTLTGLVISGYSGFERVEYWVRPLTEDSPPLADDAPELLRAPWKPAELFPPPDWDSLLPEGISRRRILGFSDTTGEPLSWPLRYGMAAWHAVLEGLPRGRYEVRARAVDANGFAQPEPRPQQKSGRNALQPKSFEVV